MNFARSGLAANSPGSAVARGAVLVDFLPQTFMVALMGSLVPSAIALRMIRRPAVSNMFAAPIRSLILRCVLIALLATFVLGGIGALLVLALLDAGWPVVVVDNLVTGFAWAVDRRARSAAGDSRRPC